MTRLVVSGTALVLLLGVVGVVRLSSGDVASRLAAVAGIDIGDPEVVGDAAATATPAPVPVRVRVRDGAGRAVADAPVDVQDRFGRALVQGLVTDNRGEARFAARPTDGVTVRARKAAVGQARATGVTIARPDGGQATFDIDLVLTANLPEAGVPPPSPTLVPSPPPSLADPPPTFISPRCGADGGASFCPGGAEGAPVATATPARLPIPRRVYVGHVQPRLTMIDVASSTSAGAPVDLGSGRLTHVAVAASGRRVFASWGGSTEVVRLRAWDLVEEGRLNLDAGTVAALATSPADGHLWVATAGAEGQDYSNVIEIDADGTRVLRRLGFNRRTGALRFTRDGSILGVAHRATSELTLVDVASGAVGTPMRLPIWAGDYQFTDDAATILVGNQSTTSVFAIDRASGQERRSYDVGTGVSAIAMIPGTSRFLVANRQLGIVQSLDIATGDVRDVVPVGQQPQAILVAGDGKRAYVANAGSASVSVIDLTTMAVTDTVATGDGASALSITP